MGGGNREQEKFGAGVERFNQIYDDREAFVTDASDDVVAAASAQHTVAAAYFTGREVELEGVDAKPADIFNFIYSQDAAERVQDLAHYFSRDVANAHFLRSVGHYKTVLKEVLQHIQQLRRGVKDYYGDMPRDFKHNQPSIPTHTGLQHEKNFSQGIRRLYEMEEAILRDNIRRSEDGRDNPDFVRWKGKLYDDTLREDSIFFGALLRDLEGNLIKSKADLVAAIAHMGAKAKDVSDMAAQRLVEVKRSPAARRIRFKEKPRTSSRRQRATEEVIDDGEAATRSPQYLLELGITEDEYFASDDLDALIKKKYREAMRLHHPDTAGRDAAAAAEKTEKSKKITEAYSTLGDPGKRDKYMAYWQRNRSQSKSKK